MARADELAPPGPEDPDGKGVLERGFFSRAHAFNASSTTRGFLPYKRVACAEIVPMGAASSNISATKRSAWESQ